MSFSVEAFSWVLYEPEQWQKYAREHHERAAVFADPYLARRHRGEKHPVEDFLFTYYTLKPAQFKRWHPGAGVILLDASEYAQQKFYMRLSAEDIAQLPLSEAHKERISSSDCAVTVDIAQFLQRRSEAVSYIYQILSNTAQKNGFFGCFGMHEWAMAYRSVENNIRHDYLPLRLGAEGTNEVVDSHRIRCSHFDAFRFFMPQAAPKNELQPTRQQQRVLEQPACLHANMDIYKWAYKLLPLVDSQLLLDCFELAWQVRELDMRAAPYDLHDWGYTPVKVETPSGKAEYVRYQRDFAARAQQLRTRLLERVSSVYSPELSPSSAHAQSV
ncbi:3-methyladenine DNA glycosylase [Rothia sp. CCM 9419]|uniref:3-methyladenine DNA glycosylase n=2 Tax=unclassified Rothia (in: high G+C Gram-positive bacteria) TaxID=2689056 RepID=UPI003ADBCB72